MSVSIRGLEEAIAALDGIVSGDNVAGALEKACLLVERSARQKAPKGDGILRNSIKSRVEGTEGIVYTPLLYAPYVEYGTGLFAEDGGRQDVPWCYQDEKGNWHTTSGQNPNPFMRPALYDNKEKIMKLLGEALKGND